MRPGLALQPQHLYCRLVPTGSEYFVLQENMHVTKFDLSAGGSGVTLTERIGR